MFSKVMQIVGPRLGLLKLGFVQRSPEIYLVSGLITGVASAVMLAKAHSKSEEVFEEVIENLDGIHTYVDESNESGDPALYVSKKEETKLLVPVYMQATREAAILYGPAVLMGISSIAFLLASHGTLQRRNKALMGTVALIERGFREYRKRVTEEYGEEAEQRIYFGAEARDVTTLVEGPDGKTKKEKSKKNHLPEVISPQIYQRVFDETNRQWQPDPDMNDFFLHAIERQVNDRYVINGYVLLNEVYKDLGFAESPEGCVVGWSRKMEGDDYISFGLENDINKREGDHRFILDFNVHGVVFDRVGEK